MSDLAAIDEVDDLAVLPRNLLAMETMLKVCRRATLLAMCEEPENALAKLRECVAGLLPRDAATQTLDGWTRLGAHSGALSGFSNLMFRPPRDAPTTDHATLYGAAWVLTSNIVRGVRHGG